MAVSIFDIFIGKFAIGSGLHNIWWNMLGLENILGVLKIGGGNARFFWRN